VAELLAGVDAAGTETLMRLLGTLVPRPRPSGPRA
jgi:hypothetical protein